MNFSKTPGKLSRGGRMACSDPDPKSMDMLERAPEFYHFYMERLPEPGSARGMNIFIVNRIYKEIMHHRSEVKMGIF